MGTLWRHRSRRRGTNNEAFPLSLCARPKSWDKTRSPKRRRSDLPPFRGGRPLLEQETCKQCALTDASDCRLCVCGEKEEVLTNPGKFVCEISGEDKDILLGNPRFQTYCTYVPSMVEFTPCKYFLSTRVAFFLLPYPSRSPCPSPGPLHPPNNDISPSLFPSL